MHLGSSENVHHSEGALKIIQSCHVKLESSPTVSVEFTYFPGQGKGGGTRKYL